MVSNQTNEFIVIVNDEGQYSLWLCGKTPPGGWAPVGVAGSRAVCMEYVDRAWIDMRPVSLQRQMGA